MKTKKSTRIFLFIIILIIILAIGTLIIKENLIKNNKNYKGELATNKQQQNLSIFVLPAIPIITIISPENITYSTNTILLNYSIKNTPDSIWYNLDNTINITIISPIYFVTTHGSHTLYLYANNTQGTASKSMSFSLDLTPTPQNPPQSTGGGSRTTKEIPIIIKFLVLNKDRVEVSLKQNETKKEQITLENVGRSKLNISLQRSGLEEFLSISETSFELAAGELKTINLDFTAKEDDIPDSYTGKLILKIEDIEKEILIYLKIEPKESFPIKETEIPKKSPWILFIIFIIIFLIILILIVLIKLKKGKKYFKKKLRQVNALREPSFG